MKSIELISQFIPIIIIFTLFTYSKPFVRFSYSILGKLFAILMVIFYTYLDKVVGLCVCGLVILYYQSDFCESMLNIDDELLNDLPDDYPDDATTHVDDYVFLQPDKKEKMMNYCEAAATVNEGAVLKYIDLTAKSDMTENIYPELGFKNRRNKPNNNKLSMIKTKMDTEISLMPVSTN